MSATAERVGADVRTRRAGADPALSWRVLRDGALPGSLNMALDHALATVVHGANGVVRFYGWDAPTVSFGRNEPARGRYERAAADTSGVRFVRRPTGGRAVVHADEITYCVVAPLRALGGAREAYARINAGLVAGLVALGVPARLSEGGATLPPDAGPCFQAPAAGEVMVGGRKLVGSAQARIGDRLLQHGSVILRGDQSLLHGLGGEPVDPTPPATLRESLGDLDAATVIDALVDGLALALGGAWSKGGYSSPEREAAEHLERERYATDTWTWRR